MSLYVIYQDIKAHGIETAVLLYLILKLIDIAPIKINPWQSLVSAIRHFFTGDLSKKIETIEVNQNEIADKFQKTQELMQARFEAIDTQMNDRFNAIDEDVSFSVAMTSRYRLIRAADELAEGREISRDHLDILLQDDKRIYETYCKKHPDYINHKGRVSVNILLEYEKLLIKREAETKFAKRGEEHEYKLEGATS